MTPQHFRTDPAASATFDRLKKNPGVATNAVIQMGFLVTEDDLADLHPHTDHVATLSPGERIDYMRDHGLAVSNERRALALVSFAPRMLADRAREQSKKSDHDREEKIAARVAELVKADDDARLAKFRAVAEREVDGVVDEPGPADERSTAKKAGRR